MDYHFQKQPQSPEQLVDILRERGLKIADPSAAIHHLHFINYYRLSGYFLHFEVLPETANKRHHQFRENVTFEGVIQHYYFDSELRQLINKSVECIEIGVRSQICLQMCLQYNDAHWYLQPSIFDDTYDHDKLMQLCIEETKRSKELYIKHYHSRYNSPKLPSSWMMAEILPMGTWSIIYAHLKERHDKKRVSDLFNLSPVVFGSWLHTLTYLRNLCAHHQRLWNRQFTFGPKKVSRYVKKLRSPKRLIAQAIVIHRLMEVIDPNFKWGQQFYSLLKKYNTINIDLMGFYQDWHEESFWAVN